eukprot:c26051_g1_i1 orf=173-2368(-)
MKKAVLPVQSASGGSSSTPTSKIDVSAQRERLLNLLKQHFGHANFRGRQLEAIEAVLSGHDCFCLMPTGGGKSLCYQIPALAKPGIVLVVSPLIALMENQVSTLKLQHIDAEFLSSTQNASTKSKIYEDLDSGKPLLRLLYVTPELIATNAFMTRLKKLHSRSLLNLIAVDEAHCISSWGHDFRSTYRQLSTLRNGLPGVPILALTATAAKRVQEDIMKSLCLHQPTVLISSFNRGNIFYEVRYKDILKNTYENLRDMIKSKPEECAIIYCHARNTCDEVGSLLQADGLSCRVYHAGLGDKVRSEALEDWASRKVPIIVGTVAFGMGIDRKDVRLVCHFNIPKSIESFYQESGRAGRDQRPARSVLYYGLDDRRSMEHILRNSPKLKRGKAGVQDPLLKKGIEDFALMVGYCEGSDCRRQKILSHFGEQVSSALCARTCDACRFPKRIAEELKQFSDFASTRGTSRLPHVFLSRPNHEGSLWQDHQSEFWNHMDEDADDSEEEISSSDDEISEIISTAARKKNHSKGQLEEKLNSLLQAEEEFMARQEVHSEKLKISEKKTVNQSVRGIAMQRLTTAIDQSLKRLQESSVNAKSAGILLENDCYKKYGKSGRPFYNSQVASTMRWLASCSMPDLLARIGHDRLKLPVEIKATDESGTSEGNPIEPKVSEVSNIEKSRCLENVNAEQHVAKTKAVMVADKTLPAIPSFGSFISKKRQQGENHIERKLKKATL